MINIGICDDIKDVLLEMNSLVSNILTHLQVDYNIHLFQSGEKLLKSSETFDVVFLDIEMPEMDGITTGELLHQKNQECKIVMATGMVERYKEAFRIQAFRFVTKPFVRSEVEEALKAVILLKQDNQSIELFFQRIQYNIPYKQIQFISAFNGYSEFQVGDRVFRKDSSLNELEQILDPKCFVRISRYYIVNLRWVQSYQAGELLINHQKLRVSKRKRKEFEEIYINYDMNYR